MIQFVQVASLAFLILQFSSTTLTATIYGTGSNMSTDVERLETIELKNQGTPEQGILAKGTIKIYFPDVNATLTINYNADENGYVASYELINDILEAVKPALTTRRPTPKPPAPQGKRPTFARRKMTPTRNLVTYPSNAMDIVRGLMSKVGLKALNMADIFELFKLK